MQTLVEMGDNIKEDLHLREREEKRGNWITGQKTVTRAYEKGI